MTRAKGLTPRDVAASVKARLLAHARDHAEDFNALLIRYVLERLLYRLFLLPVLAAAATTEAFARSWSVNGSWQPLE